MWNKLFWNSNSISTIFFIYLFQKDFPKFEDKVTYMLRKKSLAIYIWTGYKSKLDNYDNRSYLDFGIAGEVTSLQCFDVRNCI